MSGKPTQGHEPAVPQVMIVDDEPKIRSCISKLLLHEGFGVVAAEGAEECLRLLREGFRGVILMDIMMPEKDGWDTIREMDKMGQLKGNIIIMLTAKDAPDEKMEGLQEVVIDYITKPYDSEELIRTVRNYFGYLEQTTI